MSWPLVIVLLLVLVVASFNNHKLFALLVIGGTVVGGIALIAFIADPTAVLAAPYNANAHIHNHASLRFGAQSDLEDSVNEAKTKASVQMDVFIYSAAVSETDITTLRNQVSGASRRVYVVVSPANAEILPSPDLANVLTPDVQKNLIADAASLQRTIWGGLDTFAMSMASNVSKALVSHQELVQDQKVQP